MDDIGIQEVIDQVKRELLAPNPAAQARDPYPLFAVEKIELESVFQKVMLAPSDGS